MSKSRRTSESGQTMAEYAILLGGIAVACALAVLFLAGGITDRFGETEKVASSAPFRPPTTTPVLVYPTTLEECVAEGWRNFTQFDSEGACKEYVEGLTP